MLERCSSYELSGYCQRAVDHQVWVGEVRCPCPAGESPVLVVAAATPSSPLPLTWRSLKSPGVGKISGKTPGQVREMPWPDHVMVKLRFQTFNKDFKRCKEPYYDRRLLYMATIWTSVTGKAVGYVGNFREEFQGKSQRLPSGHCICSLYLTVHESLLLSDHIQCHRIYFK